jgi:hypothetical protein
MFDFQPHKHLSKQGYHQYGNTPGSSIPSFYESNSPGSENIPEGVEPMT